METFLLIIHIILAVLLISSVLLQKSDGGALGIGGSSNDLMSSRTAGNFLTKFTAVVATLFILTSISLTLVNKKDTSNIFILQNPHQLPDAYKIYRYGQASSRKTWEVVKKINNSNLGAIAAALNNAPRLKPLTEEELKEKAAQLQTKLTVFNGLHKEGDSGGPIGVVFKDKFALIGNITGQQATHTIDIIEKINKAIQVNYLNSNGNNEG
jgi:preprotein translocase subunit SecG